MISHESVAGRAAGIVGAIARTGVAAAVAVAGMGGVVVPSVAYAATEDELVAQLAEQQERLDQASAEAERIEAEIQQSEDRIAEITRDLPNRRLAAADIMRTLYKEMSTHNLQLEIILNADDIDAVMSQLSALEDVQTTSFGQINSLTNEVASNASANVERKEQLLAAEQVIEEASAAVADTEARLERVRNAPPALDGCEPIDWSLSDDEIVAEWAPRIDAYLAGHGLAGHGEDFVRAGIMYGVDPRFSVAISNTESTRGDFCFKPFNAWGYMGHSWSNWTDAIYDHTQYLSSSLYHGRLDAHTAQTYCPPTWQSWLSNTLSAARSI